MIYVQDVPPLQGDGICSGTITWGFTPGCPITGFQPAGLLLALLDRACKGEL